MCIQDFVDELNAVMPSITMENNIIHNNEGYGVILVKPNTRGNCNKTKFSILDKYDKVLALGPKWKH